MLKKECFFEILEEITLKLDILFHFSTRNKNVFGIKNTQARNMTVLQMYYDVESTYSSVNVIFIFAIASSKN